MNAILKNAPVSAQKARIVADLVRSKRLDLAISLLRFSTKKSAFLMHKLLLSALANSSTSDDCRKFYDNKKETLICISGS